MRLRFFFSAFFLGFLYSNQVYSENLTDKELTTANPKSINNPSETEAKDYYLHMGLTLSPSLLNINKKSLYYVPESLGYLSEKTMRNDLDFRFSKGGLNVQGLLRQSLDSKKSSHYRGIVNQAYYDGQFSSSLGWTVGKKVMTWGVGFGFKPLDLIQREDVRLMNPEPLVGKYIFSLDKYTANQSWSMILANPFMERKNNEDRDPSLTLRWYRFAGNSDLYGIFRLSKKRKIEMGLGFTHIIGDKWSIHGAGLFQERSHQKKNALLGSRKYFSNSDPMREGHYGNHLKAVLGLQWTGSSGWSVLLEGWYDGDAYKRKDWKALHALTREQRAMSTHVPSVLSHGNIAASSQAYLAPNLMRENLLLRISYDNRNGFLIYGDILTTPSDGGMVYTLGASWERNRSKLTMGWRHYQRKNNSAYGHSPINSGVWLQWRLMLPVNFE